MFFFAIGGKQSEICNQGMHLKSTYERSLIFFIIYNKCNINDSRYSKYYLLKLIYGYVAYSDCGLLELRLGNVQKNAFASSEATCNWLKLMEPLV